MVTMRRRRDRKGVWEVDWREDGNRYRQHFKFKENAKDFSEMKESQLERKRAAMTYITMTRFGDWADIFCRNHFKFKSKNYAEDARASIFGIYLPYFGKDTYLHNITKGDIEAFRDHRLDEDRSTKTVIGDIALLRMLFAKAVEHFYALDNPCDGVQSPRNIARKIRGAVEMADINAVLRRANAEMRKGVLMLVNTGMRVGELFNLKGCDFDLPNGFLRINSTESHTTKNYRSRIVPIPPAVIELVRNVGPDEPVMKLTQSTFQRYFSDLRQSMKMTWTLHELRHTYISRMLKEGVDKRTLREYVGHQSDQILDRYSHFIPENLQAKVNIGEEFSKPATGTVVPIWSPVKTFPIKNNNFLVDPPGLEPGTNRL